MKILLVNDYATATGGAEIQVLNMQAELRRRGHDARLFASSARPQGAASQADYECFGTTSGWRTPLQAGNLSAYARMRQVLAEFQPDVAHVSMFLTQLSPLILPLLAEVPSVLDAQWYRPICPTGTKTLPNGDACRDPAGSACNRNGCLPLRDVLLLVPQIRLWRRWDGAFDAVTACSHFLGEQLTAQGIGPVEVIWNGVPPEPACPPLAFPPTAVFAGRLVPEKGVETLVRAFDIVRKRVSEAQLIVAGDGPERGRLGRLVDALGLRSQVVLTGHLPRAEREALFSQAWVQAVPSRWAEPFGLVAVEAMMRGTAVIASAVGGLPEIVQDGVTGHLVRQGTVEAWAESLTCLLRSREQAESMGRCGRERALKEFSLKVRTDKFIEIYQNICKKETFR